jgi:NADPH:quinone reductase-like Zn-dependent oxidoreductase
VKAVWITRHGGGDVLEVRETRDPTPGAGEVRVRVKYAGLNFAEVTARQGLYPDAPKPPCIVGYEGSGVVDAVGSGVENVAAGARVIYLTRFGGHADTVVVPATQIVPMPEEMSFEDGAALPVVYITAHHMLFRIARIRGGEHVLVHMAAGGVGTAVLQLCRTVEGVVTYGTASARKHDYVREHGCDHPIDYHTQDYVEAVRKLTGGRGVDVVLDALGARDWKRGYDLLAPAGMLVAFGMANVNKGGKRRMLHVLTQVVQIPRFSPFKLMSDNRAVAGVNVGHLWSELGMLQGTLESIVALYREGRIRPHVHRAFAFSEAAEAFGELEYGRNVGKVLLKPG